MRVNCCIFQSSTVCKTKLSTQRRSCCKFVVERIIVHGKCSSALYIDNSLYNRIGKCQFTTIFYNNMYTAEYFHICQCQIASFRNIKCLRNISSYDLLPWNVMPQISVSSALVGTEPCLQIRRHTDALFLTVYITSKFTDRPWFHNIPCIESISIIFKILFLHLVCKSFLAAVNSEWQCIADCAASLLILNRHGNQIISRIFWRTAKCQITADCHINTLHTAVIACSCSFCCIWNDADTAFASIQFNLRHIIQLFPILVSNVFSFFYQCAVYFHSTVLIA